MEKVETRILAGIFLVSSATLCLEICLIRYFSVSQHYHFAFLVISIAFLGYGASGSSLTLLKKLIRLEREIFLSTTALLFSLSIFTSFLLCNAIDFDFIKLAWDESQIWLIFLFYVLLSLPFLFAGLTISYAVSRMAKSVNRIYFADLLGAGTGTLLALLIFLPEGDRGVIPLLSLLALCASWLFRKRGSPVYGILFLGFLTVWMILFFLSPSWLSFRISPFKALPVALKYPQAEHLSTKWNAVSRVDVIQSPAVRFAPGLSLLYAHILPPQLGLTVDGDDLTAVTQCTDDRDPSLAFLSALPSSYAYSLYAEPNVLILEPKGSLDVLAAHLSNSRTIKVVESNPLISKILRGDLAEFTGNLYLKSNTHIETAHSRTALNREKQKYDLIIFPLSDVFGSSGTGLYGFGENYLWTVESFSKILSALTPEGMVSMSFYLLPPPRAEIRALATWAEALERAGEDPSLHTAALRSWGTLSLFIKKNPFSPLDIRKLKTHADTFLFDLVYYPGIKREETNVHNVFKEPIYHDHFIQILSREKRKQHSDQYLFQIGPVTDNRPFFNNFFKIDRLQETYRTLGQKWLPLLQGEFVVPLLLLQAAVIAFILIFLPIILPKTRKRIKKRVFLPVFFYFSLIGMAFIFLEITLIQRFILFLGHPLYSASLVISSLLISSGLGSLGSKKILGENVGKSLRWALMLCAGLILLSVFLYPLFFRAFMNTGFLVKTVLSVIFIFPVGFFMGFPFPSGIRLLESTERNLIPWAWATNAFSSVFNCISALMIAFWGGYHLVLILSAGAYLMTIPFLKFARLKDRP